MVFMGADHEYHVILWGGHHRSGEITRGQEWSPKVRGDLHRSHHRSGEVVSRSVEATKALTRSRKVRGGQHRSDVISRSAEVTTDLTRSPKVRGGQQRSGEVTIGQGRSPQVRGGRQQVSGGHYSFG